jgi:hypothetical protein
MNIQLSFRDMSFYFGIPYDLYDQDPEKWDKVIKILILQEDTDKRIWWWDLWPWIQNIVFKHISTSFFLKRPLPQLIAFSNDYNSDKNIIISYSAGSGGHFLRNCLYFNDSSCCCFFYSWPNISVSTLDNIEEKLNYIISETEDQSVWEDPRLQLNCKLQDHKISIVIFHDISIEEILLDGLQVYPNCKTIIYYKNTKLFTWLRQYNHYADWAKKYDTICKRTILQFIKKSQETKKKLIDLCNDKTQVYSHCYIDSKITCYVWDTNWYFSEKDTIDHIKELYELLSLPRFNENAISKYYNVWIKTLSDLKTKALNEIT